MGFLFLAYLVIWLMLFAYIFSLHRKQNRLFEEIERLKQSIKTDTD